MNIKRFWKMALALALTLALLAGCGKSVYSSRAASAVNSAQNVVDFSTGTALDNALRKAVQAGGDLTAVRNALLEELGYRDAAYFSVSGIRSARTGQHAVQVYRVNGGASAAAESAAKEIASVLKALRTGGEYTGCISMVKDNGVCYIAVDLTVVKQAPSSSSGSDSGDEDPPEPTAESIAVTGLKQTYTVGDSINQDELTVSVTFSDGSIKELGKDEYNIVYDFLSEGQRDVTITYKADPSVSYKVTVTVQAAYDGKRIAVFIGSPYYSWVDNPSYPSYYLGEDCEGELFTSIQNILLNEELKNVRKDKDGGGLPIGYSAQSSMGRAMAKLRIENQSITAEKLHETIHKTHTLLDLAKIEETIKSSGKNIYNISSFVIAEVTINNVVDLSAADRTAAAQLNDLLCTEIDKNAPGADATFEVAGKDDEPRTGTFSYSASDVAMIREHVGGMNFKYYAAVELCGNFRLD